jgi:two-component system chemotaxis response regulator CheY
MAKILIVDDSETLRSQLRRDLETAGHEVVEAVDGEDGLRLFAAHRDAQLIVCDFNMPRLDGLSMCEKLAGLEGPKPPIFMLTTESSRETVARGKRAGVIAWIVKPHSAAALLSAIDKVTKR